MRFARYFLALIVCFSQFSIAPAASADSPPIVLTHVMAGEPSAASSEFIALYNSTDNAVDLTGYCLKNKSDVKFACISAEPSTRVYVKAKKFLTVVSSNYASRHSYQADTIYTPTNQSSGSIIGSEDTISLVNAEGQVVDSHTWSSGLTAGSIWQRKETAPGQFVDTNDPADFVVVSSPLFPPNDSYDEEVIVDHCPNISGTQQQVPDGYVVDEVGECRQDVCPNIDGLQVEPPEWYGVHNGSCILNVPKLQLSELLPNAVGSDTGNEFIEIYNPTDQAIDLGYYKVLVGANKEKSYQLPSGTSINPGEYKALYDSKLKFSLANTSGRAVLATIDGQELSDTGIYEQPEEGEAWALFGTTWRYTNQPTSDQSNRESIVGGQGSVSEDAPLPCPAGKYRHPLTQRCRNIETDATVASCDADQYRHPETGRCRKITAATTLAACKDGQYRSEETNRCRNIESASATLAACKEGQERNPETNRCRNVASAVPAAGFAVQPVNEGSQAFIGWWVLGGVLLLALGYAAWEWRREVKAWFGRFALRRK